MPSVPSDKASQRTLRRWSKELMKLREDLTGGESQYQIADEIRMIPKEERGHNERTQFYN